MKNGPVFASTQKVSKVDKFDLYDAIITRQFFFYYFFVIVIVSSTQQLILSTLFITRPVSSDQTDFIRDSNKMSKNELVLYITLSSKGENSKTPTRNTRRI